MQICADKPVTPVQSCRLTQFISDRDLSRGDGGLAHAGRVAAAHTEAVGFPLGQVKQGKAGRLDWRSGVHPMPGFCSCNTLR